MIWNVRMTRIRLFKIQFVLICLFLEFRILYAGLKCHRNDSKSYFKNCVKCFVNVYFAKMSLYSSVQSIVVCKFHEIFPVRYKSVIWRSWSGRCVSFDPSICRTLDSCWEVGNWRKSMIALQATFNQNRCHICHKKKTVSIFNPWIPSFSLRIRCPISFSSCWRTCIIPLDS